MNKEQDAVLKLKGLEQKREAAQKELGLEGLTFRQILEEAPEEVSASLSPLFDQLSERVTSFRSVSESAKDIIEVNLHMIQSALASEGPGRDIYSASGKKTDNDNRKRFTSRSV